ncbi:hypothetical protein R1sor_017627 [Riccia sorocarpa]|uniref:PLAT domain-containing protein n=1 Tax=Riccia sorocarpa TaxID=122646 RepID=A0ABD3IB28_9MARC
MGTSRCCLGNTSGNAVLVIQMGLGLSVLSLLLSFSTASADTVPVDSSSSEKLQTNGNANLEINNEICSYTVTTVTGKRAGSSTDSVISARLENSRGESVYFSELDNGKKRFQRGHSDKFVMMGDCVTNLCKLTLYTDDSSDFGAWFVETVSYSVQTPSGPEHKTWEVQEWLPRDDDSTELFLVVDDCPKETI